MIMKYVPPALAFFSSPTDVCVYLFIWNLYLYVSLNMSYISLILKSKTELLVVNALSLFLPQSNLSQ